MVPVCKSCGEPLEGHGASCAACGAPAPDSTASFEPVRADEPVRVPIEEESEGPVLVVRKGPQPGERFFIDRPKLTLGRDPESDIFLNDMTVSREHAVLTLDAGRVTIRDVGSLNGTTVNGTLAEEAVLEDGDSVQIGTFQMVYYSGDAR